MEYFILQLDETHTPCWPVGNYGKIDAKTLKGKQFYELPKFLSFSVEETVDEFPDLIMKPCFMVSGRVKQVILLYNKSLPFRRILLYSKTQGKSQSYYIPFLEEVDCLTEASQFNMDKSVIRHAVIDGDLLHDKAIVRIKGVNSIYVLIRLDLAESLLERHFMGFDLKETVTLYNGKPIDISAFT